MPEDLKPRELRVVKTDTGEVVRTIPITGDKSERQIERIIGGILLNAADGFHVEDSADDAKVEPTKTVKPAKSRRG